ncbi:MAG: hydroxyacylglutathione hydrolase [Verrucomicrobiales bacterium]|jgi:hydroxyacylglutathione hydrolase
MFTIKTYCGGICLTNGYAIECPDGTVVIDAPEGMRDWLTENKLDPKALLLTHLHFDHVMDAAAIAQSFGCPVFAHSALTAELHLGDLFAQFTGEAITIPEFSIDEILADATTTTAAGATFEVIYVPGHSPDSVCFHLAQEGILFAGDTLFQSGVGRSDFPGGNEALLLGGIREKLLTLPGDTHVYPGHGGDTTVSAEKTGNPYIQ